MPASSHRAHVSSSTVISLLPAELLYGICIPNLPIKPEMSGLAFNATVCVDWLASSPDSFDTLRKASS